MRLCRLCLVFFSVLFSLSAQVNFSISTSSLNIKTGQSGTFTISISGATGVAGVQWVVSAPPSGVTLNYTTAVAGKEIQCLPAGTKCLVSGMNAAVIPVGVVGTATLTVSPTATPGNFTLTFSGFVAATPAGIGSAIGTVPLPILLKIINPKDLNGDGVIDHVDFLLSVDQILGGTACATADLNGDGVCDVRDLILLVI